MLTLLLVSLIVIFLIRLYTRISRFLHRRRKGKPTVAIVVVGDIGKSPRMQNHALSLAQNGFKTLIFGFNDSRAHHSISENDNIRIVGIRNISLFPPNSLLHYASKFLLMHFSLFAAMLPHLSHDLIIVQNPPSIPSLLVAYAVTLLNCAPVLIDWHNYGFSILACNTHNTLLVRLYKLYERLLGKLSFANLCVSKRMMVDLENNWGISARVLYDRPPSRVIRCPDMGRGEMRSFLAGKYKLCDKFADSLVVVSSTSWTPDEDFGILMRAFDVYEEESAKRPLPFICCVITGKGPMREEYLRQVAERDYGSVSVTSVWLEAEDYPLMLRSADLGVCLHTSSSGLDLPMKVVDMLAAEVVVLAYYYPCIEELVDDGRTGYTFRDYSELAQLLMTLDVEGCRRKLHLGFESDWETEWNRVVLPIVDNCYNL